MWVFEGIWVICAKLPFLPSLDVPIKMFANSLAILNQQTLRRINHVHCFQTQLTESCLVVCFWVDKRFICCFFLNKKQSEYPDYVLSCWQVEQTLSFLSTLKYFYLCSRYTVRYTLAYAHAWTTIWGAQNVRCTIVYAICSNSPVLNGKLPFSEGTSRPTVYS